MYKSKQLFTKLKTVWDIVTRNVNRLISDISYISLIFTVTNVGEKLIEMCGGIADLGVEIAQRFVFSS